MQSINQHTILPLIFRPCLLLISLLLSGAAAAQVTILLEIDTAAMMAEPVDLKITIQYDASVELKDLDLHYLDSINTIQNMMMQAMGKDGKLNPGEFEILDYGRWKPNGNNKVNLQNDQTTQSSNQLVNTYKCIFWEEGQYIIPEIAVTYLNSGRAAAVSSNAAFVEVKSVLPPEAEVPLDSLQLQPIKPFIGEPLLVRDYIWSIVGLIIVLALFILALVLLLRQKENKRTVIKVAKKIPAHEIASEKLMDLKGKQLWQKGNIKEYQSELTYIVREYLENRYRIKALESTTFGISQQLNKLELAEATKGDIKGMLQIADMVKFAKATPPESAHEEFMNHAVDFVEQTKQLEIPEEEEPESTAKKEPQWEHASLLQRALATLIDSLIIAVVNLTILTIFFLSIFNSQLSFWYILEKLVFDIYGVLILAALFILTWLYYAILDSRRGGTIGKQIMNLQVTTLSRESITFGQASLRFFVRILSAIPICGGFIYAAFNDKKQTLHDLLAKCIVIKEKDA